MALITVVSGILGTRASKSASRASILPRSQHGARCPDAPEAPRCFDLLQTFGLLWCGAHVFEGFFGLKDEPPNLSNEGRKRFGILWRLPHKFALCSLQFRFALRLSLGRVFPASHTPHLLEHNKNNNKKASYGTQTGK